MSQSKADEIKENMNNKELVLNEIDHILDEIEQRQKAENVEEKNEDEVDWKGILGFIQRKDLRSIKTLIASKELNINPIFSE